LPPGSNCFSIISVADTSLEVSNPAKLSVVREPGTCASAGLIPHANQGRLRIAGAPECYSMIGSEILAGHTKRNDRFVKPL